MRLLGEGGLELAWRAQGPLTVRAGFARGLCGLCGDGRAEGWPQFGLGPARSPQQLADSWLLDDECGVDEHGADAQPTPAPDR